MYQEKNVCSFISSKSDTGDILNEFLFEIISYFGKLFV